MRQINNHFYGSVNASIAKLYAAVPSLFKEILYWTVTVLDSSHGNFHVEHLKEALSKKNIDASVQKDVLIFRGSELAKLLSEKFFRGFDEMWGFDRDISNSFQRPLARLDCREDF